MQSRNWAPTADAIEEVALNGIVVQRSVDVHLGLQAASGMLAFSHADM